MSPLVISTGATLASWPLFNRTLTDVLHGRVIGLNPLLGTGDLLAILTGEPLTALEVVWVIELGRLLENYIIYRSDRAVLEILQGTVKPVQVLKDGLVLELPPDQVEIGDLVQVHATERIPVDGRIIGGEALVDLSHLSGHKKGEFHQEGQQVWAGTLVQTGKLDIKAEKVGPHTYFARILAAVKKSLQRSPGEQKADNLILIKGGTYLERFGTTDCLCLDKTGTINSDTPQVVEVIPSSGSPSQEILFLAASAEQHNPHPVSRAILQAASAEGYQPEPGWVSEFLLGQGVRAAKDGKVVLVGSRHLMGQEGLALGDQHRVAQGREDAGEMSVFVAQDDEILGLIRVAHPVRPNIPLGACPTMPLFSLFDLVSS